LTNMASAGTGAASSGRSALASVRFALIQAAIDALYQITTGACVPRALPSQLPSIRLAT
jgi:hypothetical protein